eukprot:163354-Pelagomonas_calceolata.AAC.11
MYCRSNVKYLVGAKGAEAAHSKCQPSHSVWNGTSEAGHMRPAVLFSALPYAGTAQYIHEHKLEKSVWDAMDIERVKMATDPKLSADVAAVLITVCIHTVLD